MSIKQIEVYRLTLDYKHEFRIAPRRKTRLNDLLARATAVRQQIRSLHTAKRYSIEKVIVRVVADHGTIGWGEASPSRRVTGETIETVIRTLTKLAPHLIGKSSSDIEGNMEFLGSIVPGQPAAKACIDIALHDLFGKATGQSVFMQLGGLKRDVLTDFSIGIDSPQRMASAAAKAVAKGFRALKIKVGANPVEELKRVELVREAVGSDIEVRVDANEGWTVRQAIDMVNKMEQFNICFIEQPVAAADLHGLAQVRKNSPIPIMADESVCSEKDARRLIQTEAADLINIKLMKSGGMLEAVKIARTAEDAKMPCMMGCMMETKIGITAAASLAGSIENITYADLDSDLLLEEKLVEGGASTESSIRKLPKNPGLGITKLNETLLGKPTKVFK